MRLTFDEYMNLSQSQKGSPNREGAALQAIILLANEGRVNYEILGGLVVDKRAACESITIDVLIDDVNVLLKDHQPEYLGSNPGAVFETGDRVVVFAQKGDYPRAKVIGFESEPKAGLGDPDKIVAMPFLHPEHEIDLATDSPATVVWDSVTYKIYSRHPKYMPTIFTGATAGWTALLSLSGGPSVTCADVRSLWIGTLDDTINSSPHAQFTGVHNTVDHEFYGYWLRAAFSNGPTAVDIFRNTIHGFFSIKLPQNNTEFKKVFDHDREDVNILRFSFPAFTGKREVGGFDLFPTVSFDENVTVNFILDPFETREMLIWASDPVLNVCGNKMFTQVKDKVLPFCPFPTQTTYAMIGLIPDITTSIEYFPDVASLPITRFPHWEVFPK